MAKLATLTGNVVYNYYSHPCSYRVHLDLSAEKPERTPPAPTGRYLMERGIRHEARVFDDIRAEFPGQCVALEARDVKDREADIARRIAETEEAIRQGVRWIFHGFLCSKPGEVEHVRPGGGCEPSDLVFRGETDILMRIDEPSELGEFSYVVGDVKSSRHAKFAQKMQVAFYSRLIEKLQGVMPRTGFIVTGEGEREEFETDELIWTLKHFVEEEVHEYRDPSRVFHHLEIQCKQCHWFDHCRERAAAEDDVSLIPGCRRTEKRALAAAGIPSRAALGARSDEELRALGRTFGNKLDGFRDLKQRASAQEMGRPIVRQSPWGSAGRNAGGAPDLFTHRGPLLLVAALHDGYAGAEAAISLDMVRPDDMKVGAGPRNAPKFFCAEPGDPPGEMLRRLFTEVAQANKLLKSRAEEVLPIFVDRGLPFRLRREAEGLGEERPGATNFIERLLADSVVLTDVADRTWFLPVAARNARDLAAALAPRKQPRETRSAFDEESCRDAAARLGEIETEYGLAAGALCDPEADLRPLIVRERRANPDGGWTSLMEFELAEDLRAARDVLERLWRMKG